MSDQPDENNDLLNNNTDTTAQEPNNTQPEEGSSKKKRKRDRSGEEKDKKKKKRDKDRTGDKKKKKSSSKSDMSDSLKRIATDAVKDIFNQNKEKQFDYVNLILKADHAMRPIWVTPDKHIFLETFSPIYAQAYDFLVAIAEPLSRPENIHEYVLTDYSLYAAVSIGLSTEQIVKVLEKLSKVELEKSVETYIRDATGNYGKVKLILQKNEFFVESQSIKVLEQLMNDSEIKGAVKVPDPVQNSNVDPSGRFLVRMQSTTDTDSYRLAQEVKALTVAAEKNASNVQDGDDEDEENGDGQEDKIKMYSFGIVAEKVGKIKERCIKLDLPVLEEYDFRNDKNTKLDIDLRPTTTIRSYQERSLSKMFGNARARSGIIVLPCGAGKTLTGITAASTIKRSTLVLCINAVSVEQWKNQFKLWTNVDESRIVCFTSTVKEKLPLTGASIIITTYNMISHNRKRSIEGQRIMQQISEREWGMMLLDEVHVVPAETFRRVIEVVKAHCKLGLTATLLREDNLTDDLYFLIGPKLYEANWLDLQKKGHLATVHCVEVWCPMTPEFYREYLTTNHNKRQLLYVMNPNKFRACEYLLKYHEARGDKIIVFADNIFALEEYARELKRAFIFGDTSQAERIEIFKKFRTTTQINTIFISKVGDTAIDLPEATVILQISSHFGSRRQEAQRLGRILRPKGQGKGQNSAYFYSLVSLDTAEMFFSSRRQQFLINQGYAFRVLANIDEQIRNDKDIIVESFKGKAQELTMLAKIKAADDTKGVLEKVKQDPDEVVSQKSRSNGALTLGGLSGGESGLMYQEYGNASRAKKGASTSKHPLFKNRNK
ncbi:DNA excision repair protein ERCC [Acrasis kona]|uniref:DNA 3'-5' helicase n=1 Tax=Acrasis kona TaxID=1008807 RepID=A0AAW2Z0E5_9EUKA